jgi:hypothetical protein
VVVAKFEVLKRHLHGEAEENHKIIPVRIMGAPIDIRTGHLVDTGLDESAE